jgi:hypothetical protein
LITLAIQFTGWFFQIDAVNEYHRGTLLPLSFVYRSCRWLSQPAKVLIRRIKAGKENVKLVKSASGIAGFKVYGHTRSVE